MLKEGKIVRILDTKTDQAITIREGDYQLQPVGGDNTVSITPKQLVLKRGGKLIVSVEKKPLDENDTAVADIDDDSSLVFDGKPLEYWVKVARRDTDPNVLTKAIEAMNLLSDESTVHTTLNPTFRVARLYYHKLGPKILTELCRPFRKAAPADSADAIIGEIRSGNRSSRRLIGELVKKHPEPFGKLIDPTEGLQKELAKRTAEFVEAIDEIPRDDLTNEWAAITLYQFDEMLKELMKDSDRKLVLDAMVARLPDLPLSRRILPVLQTIADQAPETSGLAEALIQVSQGPMTSGEQLEVHRLLANLPADRELAIKYFKDRLSDPDYCRRIEKRELLVILGSLETIGPEAWPALEDTYSQLTEFHPLMRADVFRTLKKIAPAGFTPFASDKTDDQ